MIKGETIDLLENYHLIYVSLFLTMFYFPLFCVGFNQHLLLLKNGEHIFGLHQGVNTWPIQLLLHLRQYSDSGCSLEGFMTSLE